MLKTLTTIAMMAASTVAAQDLTPTAEEGEVHVAQTFDSGLVGLVIVLHDFCVPTAEVAYTYELLDRVDYTLHATDAQIANATETALAMYNVINEHGCDVAYGVLDTFRK